MRPLHDVDTLLNDLKKRSFGNAALADTVLLSLFMRDNAYAAFLTPPGPGLSATLFPNDRVKPYSPKGPENVKITTLFRCKGGVLGQPHSRMTAVVISK